MVQTIAKLSEFDVSDKTHYILNWVGRVRRSPKASNVYETFVRFVSKESPKEHIDLWIPFEKFPFLILGSEWYRGIMVGKPLGSRFVPLELGKPMTWRIPSMQSIQRRIYFGDAYRLAFDTPASPVLELETRNGEILYAPLSEILRAHYLFCPKALPSLIGGLSSLGGLADKSLEAWRPQETKWLNWEDRVATIYRAHFISDDEAKRLARVLFDLRGKESLKQLRRWVELNFNRSDASQDRDSLADLPRLTLPYRACGWNVVARNLSRSEDGRKRSLVLQINSFEAPEPYKELHLEAELVPTELGEGAGSNVVDPGRGGKILTPKPPTELPVEDGDSDGGMAPVYLEDILPVDRSSRRRKPIKEKSSNRDIDHPGPTHVPTPDPVGSGSTGNSGPGGHGRASVVFRGDGENSAIRSPEMRKLTELVYDAICELVKRHQTCGISAGCELLPDKDRAYCFRVPKSCTELAKNCAIDRQYLVIAVHITGKYAYIIDPEQRLASDSFPLGIWATRDETSSHPTFEPFGTAQIERIVSEFESAHRQGHSWLKIKELEKEFISVPVRHFPKKDPSEGEIKGFKQRVVDSVAGLIGHLDVLAETSSTQKRDAAA